MRDVLNEILAKNLAPSEFVRELSQEYLAASVDGRTQIALSIMVDLAARIAQRAETAPSDTRRAG